jgi:hypothetical protein
MPAGRIALVAAGLLIAAGAILIVVLGFRGASAGASAGMEDRANADGAEGAGGAAGDAHAEAKAPLPRWQSFMKADSRTTPPRPLVHLSLRQLSPFARPAGGTRAESPDLRLEGISAGAETVALISGHAVHEGGTIAGFQVVHIGRSAVTLAGPRGTRIDLRREKPEPLSPRRIDSLAAAAARPAPRAASHRPVPAGASGTARTAARGAGTLQASGSEG